MGQAYGSLLQMRAVRANGNVHSSYSWAEPRPVPHITQEEKTLQKTLHQTNRWHNVMETDWTRWVPVTSGIYLAVVNNKAEWAVGPLPRWVTHAEHDGWQFHEPPSPTVNFPVNQSAALLPELTCKLSMYDDTLLILIFLSIKLKLSSWKSITKDMWALLYFTKNECIVLSKRWLSVSSAYSGEHRELCVQ